MTNKILSIFAALVLITNSCTKVPVTGRRQLSTYPETDMIKLSSVEYVKFLAANPPLPATDERVKMVRTIGDSIRMAVEQYFKEKKKTSWLAGYKWEFNVVDSKTVNAWCMPGGKVVVYTGLLPVTLNKNALAVVMGHEIAHAIARHGNERMSQAMIAQMGAKALSVGLSGTSSATQNLFLQSYGIGSNLGLLKYSRKHESEADKIGLVFMAMAGYNPQEAIAFWQRMSKLGGGGGLEMLSTHPSDETRVKDLQKFMPTALKYYKKK
jgi:predicted Zn-dependent protease